MIEVQQLTKAYKGHFGSETVAVDGISFTVQGGEIYGLLGPNGAGKTTTLRMLSTMLQPTSGDAILDGYSVKEKPEEVRKRIGFVSGTTGVYDRMTAWELVEYFGQLHQIEPKLLKSRMEALFERLSMQEIRNRLCAKMSTGMKQKVSIARALVHDPPILIFDEATAGLDVMVARNLLEIISELRDQGKCIVFSTHIMPEAELLCHRVGILYHGHLLEEGTLEDLSEKYGDARLNEIFFQIVRHYEETELQNRSTSTNSTE
ncbi:ABC transporter ATP-binding protein NatA [Planctomycetales bacterium 10988]|nr:ABC transporter ATP-binding protein NatA [Planctomycetales bacterium 10988]